jgi:hypothetical protein
MKETQAVFNEKEKLYDTSLANYIIEAKGPV